MPASTRAIRMQSAFGAGLRQRCAEAGRGEIERLLERHLDQIVRLPPPLLRRDATGAGGLLSERDRLLEGIAALGCRAAAILLIAVPVEAMRLCAV